MDIYSIFALLFGIIVKLFDDIIDNPVFRSIFGSFDKLTEEILKSLIITLTVILIMKEPLIGLIFVIFIIAVIISDVFFYKKEMYEHKGMDHDFWWAYSLVIILLTVFVFLIKNDINLNIPIFIVVCLFIFALYIAEPYLIPENNSKRKIYSRIILTILFASFIYFRDELNTIISINEDIVYLILLALGYTSTSVIINTFISPNDDTHLN
jgi:hypothetical protein